MWPPKIAAQQAAKRVPQRLGKDKAGVAGVVVVMCAVVADGVARGPLTPSPPTGKSWATPVPFGSGAFPDSQTSVEH